MEGKIVLEAIENGLSVNMNISQVSRVDKMMLISVLANSLQLNISDRFAAACFLIDPDTTAQVKENSVVIPGDMAEWLAKKNDGGKL